MTGFAFNIVRINAAANVQTGIKAPSFQRREQYAPMGADGTLHITSDAVMRAAPMASWRTVSVRSLVALLAGSAELPMVALDATNGLELIAGQINTAGPGYLAGSTHARRQMLRGQIYLSGLSWSPGNPLEAAVEAFGISTAGGTDPVGSTAVQALPTLAVNTEQLALSSLTVGGTPVTRVQSYEVQIAHRCENNVEPLCFDAGLPFPVMLAEAGVNGQSEIIATIDTLDLTTVFSSGAVVAAFKTLTALGVGLTSNTTTATLNSSLIREETIEGANGQPAGRRLTIRATFDGTNRPLTLANA